MSLPLEDGPVTTSVLEYRKRETAILDRYIAITVGEELRKVESDLSEESGGLDELFHRLQVRSLIRMPIKADRKPCARIEDLLLTLPTSIITLFLSSGNQTFPLPHSHLAITLTPSWVQVILHSRPVWEPGNRSKELVVEVRREATLEGCARRVGEGLDDIRRGFVTWGERVW